MRYTLSLIFLVPGIILFVMLQIGWIIVDETNNQVIVYVLGAIMVLFGLVILFSKQLFSIIQKSSDTKTN